MNPPMMLIALMTAHALPLPEEDTDHAEPIRLL